MTVTGLAKNVFAVTWTAGWAGFAVAKHAVTGIDAVTVHTPQWARGLVRGVGIDLHVYGAEQLDPEATYVVMANHQSHLDIPSLVVAMPLPIGFLAKKELRRVPFLGAAMEVGGHVFIDRAQRREAFRAIGEAATRVREGRSIVIFPEGTRGEREVVRPLKKGGFHLVRQAGVPLVPVGIRGSGRVMHKNSASIAGGRVEVHIGAPLSPERIAAAAVPELMADVRSAIAHLADMPLDDGKSVSRPPDVGPERSAPA